MKPRRPKQPTSPELLDSILDFLQRKFYQGDAVSFRKDRARLQSQTSIGRMSAAIGALNFQRMTGDL
jgi:hypothetical protein